MSGFLSTKIKRKDLEEVYDEFSEFSLNSPARKIRRLDSELPPIMEEEEPSVPLLFEQQVPTEIASGSGMPELGPVMVDAEHFLPLNEERALVLYKPVNNTLVLSSPSSLNVSFSVNSDLLHGLKKVPVDDKPAFANNALAVVPWVPSQIPTTTYSDSRGVLSEEPIEAEEEAGCASMEVEEDKSQAGSSGVGEGFHQWQQHCLIPQLPQNTSTPIMWSWG